MNNLDRCLAYLPKLPAAISGSGGSKATMRAARTCRRFGLSDGEMWQALTWFNENRCSPPWSEKELRHKLASVEATPVQRPLGQSRGNKSYIKPVTAAELAGLSARHRKAEVPRLPAPLPMIQRSETDDYADLSQVWDAWRADAEPAHERRHTLAYAQAAIHARLPFYGDDQKDMGSRGWLNWSGAGVPLGNVA